MYNLAINTKCSCGVVGCSGDSLEHWNKYYSELKEWWSKKPVIPKTCTTNPSPRFVCITKGDPEFEQYIIDIETEIKNIFPVGTKLINDSYMDPESTIETECFVLRIQTELDFFEANNLLDSFIEKFLIKHKSYKKYNLCVTI